MTGQATIISQRPSSGALVILQGPHQGASFPLSGRPTVIGRDEGTDIVLSDPECSRRHALIGWQAGQFMIEDIGSTNGTYVNGVQISAPQMLFPGDKIGVGQTTLILEVAAEQARMPHERSQPTFDVVPSRAVLTAAIETNQRLGHENLGFLSESHGIMPAKPPLLHLPPAYQIWDEMAESLPELFRTLTVRKAFDAMPALSAEDGDLPDEYLLRASVLMSMFAHSYFRIEHDPSPSLTLPESIQRPWVQITRRLERPAPHLSYIDLIMYNWRLIDPTADDPMRIENMRLLVPTVGNAEEQIFYLTQIEILAQSSPLIGAIARAQEAARRDDVDGLKEELILIANGLHHVANVSFMKINPNIYSDTYVDPVVWAKTVAPFAVPIREGTAGPSGTSAPIFHILDNFFGRHTYGTRFGNEMIHLREWYPKHWRDFIEAIGQFSVSDYVEASRSKTLQGIFKEAAQAYVGDTGFLSRHRLKVYGFLDIGFKVGRNVTITGFSGLFKDRTWDAVDFELESSRTERHIGLPRSTHYANVKEVRTVRAEGERWVKQVVLDVAGTGVRYRPGDRCAILPENSDALVQRTLRALHARGNEPIRLNAAWRDAVTLREGFEDMTTLPLSTLLTFGRIRPVERPVAKALYAVSHNEALRRIIEARAEDQWELWDLVDMLSEAGFDPRRIWKAHPGERESICWVVPPELFRQYSVSSVMEKDALDGASELHLTIGRLIYETQDTEVSVNSERLGTASNYLGDTSAVAAEDMGRVSIKLVQPPRFSLPDDESTPVVMFAGGTGLAPFRSFLHERARQPKAGESWLFFGTRTSADFFYKEELEQIAAQGWLNVRVAFSRDDLYARYEPTVDGGQFVFAPGRRQYIGDAMLEEDTADVLWDLLRSKAEGGKGAYFYVCGRTGFASAVMEGIKEVIRRHADDTGEEQEETVQRVLYRLVGEDRYMQDVFTTYRGSHIDQQQTFDASEIVLHNDTENGHWMVIDGRVYDLTTFAHIHPGGFKIVSGYAGMDATQAYRSVLHHVNSEVDAMLGMYEIGAVRRLNFGMEWGAAVGPNGLRFVSLADAYRAWVRFLYTVVEIENALHNDFTIRGRPLTLNEHPGSPSPLRTQLLIEVHHRFMLNYLAAAVGETLENLWAVTSGLCAQDESVGWMRSAVDALRQTAEAERVSQLGNELAARLDAVVQGEVGPDDPLVELLTGYCDLLEVEDKRFVHEVKLALREGVQVFEELERDTINQGGERLLKAARQIPLLLEAYFAGVFDGVQRLDAQGS